ncbi:hypothetical protein PAMA_007269 [Pampus argenteus]
MFLLIACCALKSQFTNRSVATYLLFCGTCDKLGDVVIFTQKVNRKEETAESFCLLTERRHRMALLGLTLMFLLLFEVSLSPPDADLKRDDTIMVDCSLLGFDTNRRRCQQQRIRWVDEAGSELLGEGGGHKVIGQRNCLSSLTVKRHSGLNRKYTCQVLDRNNNKVLIDVDYTPVFTGTMSDDQSNTAADWSYLGFIFLTLRITGLITIIIILLIQGRGNKTPPGGNNVHNDVKAPAAASRRHNVNIN